MTNRLITAAVVLAAVIAVCIEGSVVGTAGVGRVTYFGPGAPAGPRYHHYVFELYALSKTLDLPLEATRAQLLDAMKDVIVAKPRTSAASDSSRCARILPIGFAWNELAANARVRLARDHEQLSTTLA
jgi:hypothetical protein